MKKGSFLLLVARIRIPHVDGHPEMAARRITDAITSLRSPPRRRIRGRDVVSGRWAEQIRNVFNCFSKHLYSDDTPLTPSQSVSLPTHSALRTNASVSCLSFCSAVGTGTGAPGGQSRAVERPPPASEWQGAGLGGNPSLTHAPRDTHRSEGLLYTGHTRLDTRRSFRCIGTGRSLSILLRDADSAARIGASRGDAERLAIARWYARP